MTMMKYFYAMMPASLRAAVRTGPMLGFAVTIVFSGCAAGTHDAGHDSGEEQAGVMWNKGYLVAPVVPGPAALYVTIHNHTDTPDTLLRVTTPVSDTVHLHVTHRLQDSSGHEFVRMEPVAALPVAADTMFAFQPGGTHIMVSGMKTPVTRGDSIAVTLHFAKAGAIDGKAAVIGYADADTALGGSAPMHDQSAHDHHAH